MTKQSYFKKARSNGQHFIVNIAEGAIKEKRDKRDTFTAKRYVTFVISFYW